MAGLTRRQIIQHAAFAGVCLTGGTSILPILAAQQGPATVPATQGAEGACTWLETPQKPLTIGVTWGVPWARGALKADQPIRVEANGTPVAAQTWPLAFWPDGSIKWTAHAMPPGDAVNQPFDVRVGEPAEPAQRIQVVEQPDSLTIDTGLMRCTVARKGPSIITLIERGGRRSLENGRLTAQRQGAPGDAPRAERESFIGQVETVQLEQAGPVRAVVRLSGRHIDEKGRTWLPFVVRMYFYAGSDAIRLMHTFIYDGDEHNDFLCGLGVRFDVPMSDALHDRHVRFVGHEHGLFGEAVRPVTGLRRDPGEAVRKAQVAGVATPPLDQWASSVSQRLELIPAWGDFTLTQLAADGFQIRKRTKAGHAWIPAGTGTRSGGVGYIGSISGGVSFGIRNFWQSHPAQLDVRHAAGERAEVTMWLFSPEAQPMDMRFYHDGLGMDTYPEQIEGLNITYEDYEPGYGTPHGIARTSEMYLRIEGSTPSRQALVEFADDVRKPPQLVCTPVRLLQSGVFGAQWTLPDRSNPTRAWIEDRLQFMLDRYVLEVDQRSWYGFWDYGDVMHSYDSDRHVWRYDIGGYAWDNSELSTDIWLWMGFLRTGRADVYRMAEAMTRHTGEVDVYHLGRFKGLGTRHSVQHWGDSSKQSRISTAANRRYYYFLSGGDERVGDLLRDQLATIETEKKIVVGRKLGENAPVLPLPPVENPPPGGTVAIGSMGWGNAMAAWITEAERTGDPRWHDKIVLSMRGVAELPNGFFSRGWSIDIDTGAITHDGNMEVSISHLASCFGLPEVTHELILTYGDQAPRLAETWAHYGRNYNADRAERAREMGKDFRSGGLRDAHSRCTAYAAKFAGSDALAERALRELLGDGPVAERKLRPITRVTGPDVLNPVDEGLLGTNGAAQWSLAAMECLAFLGDKVR